MDSPPDFNFRGLLLQFIEDKNAMKAFAVNGAQCGLKLCMLAGERLFRHDALSSGVAHKADLQRHIENYRRAIEARALRDLDHWPARLRAQVGRIRDGELTEH